MSCMSWGLLYCQSTVATYTVTDKATEDDVVLRPTREGDLEGLFPAATLALTYTGNSSVLRTPFSDPQYIARMPPRPLPRPIIDSNHPLVVDVPVVCFPDPT
ncbi:hypothetical protein EDB86DRAFT_1949207 [Lactarius hatsudake]|nr:hypothetical protein EDB86DRAFT_1949207 [Lactarius hatsudake]